MNLQQAGANMHQSEFVSLALRMWENGGGSDGSVHEEEHCGGCATWCLAANEHVTCNDLLRQQTSW
jgi:hypothetical protein